jgi:hypothetical protein
MQHTEHTLQLSGSQIGSTVGIKVGASVGTFEGAVVGARVGAAVGVWVWIWNTSASKSSVEGVFMLNVAGEIKPLSTTLCARSFAAAMTLSIVRPSVPFSSCIN